MIPIYKSWLIQIEITNACTHQCANCTRFVGHHKKPYFMSLEQIEEALDSLKGYQGGIGIMGGEPTLHPKFPEICEMALKKYGPYKLGLWTSGYKWEEYKKLIKRTFKFVCSYNDHTYEEQKHQPVLVAIDDVIEDKNLMWKLIDKCWVQEKWSPAINPKGGFFCEVAAAMDILMEGPGGYKLEKGWWLKTPEEFRDQVERYCKMCGAALPFTCPSNKETKDLISISNLNRLKELKSPKIMNNRYELFDKKLDKEVFEALNSKKWDPWNYLGIKNFGLILNFFGEFTRKKKWKLDELWLLNRGTYNLYRVFVRIKRKFEKKPDINKL